MRADVATPSIDVAASSTGIVASNGEFFVMFHNVSATAWLPLASGITKTPQGSAIMMQGIAINPQKSAMTRQGSSILL